MNAAESTAGCCFDLDTEADSETGTEAVGCDKQSSGCIVL